MKIKTESEYVIAMILAIIIGCIIFVMVDMSSAKEYPDNGVIVDLSFTQWHTSTTNGVILNSKGGVSPVVGTTSTPDEWVAMVKTKNGVVKVDCVPDHYYGHKIGDTLKFARFYGKWTGIHWANKSVK